MSRFKPDPTDPVANEKALTRRQRRAREWDRKCAENRRLSESNERLRNPEPCHWICNGVDLEYFETSCGVTWSFEADGPRENGAKFCPGCGHPIAVMVKEVDRG